MLTVKQIRGLFLDYWWILALALVLISTTLYLFCGDGRNDKNERIESNIDQQKGINGVISNQIKNAETGVNDAANQSNQAEGNLANSINRDSSTFSGNSTDKFCERFGCDSSCAEWRARHPEIRCR